ncbi:MAG: HipA domain-containing protein, partial [Steroidobacter sp.]
MRLTYAADYAAAHLFANDHRALSVRLPVDFGDRAFQTWPAFLIDLLPQGAARRRVERAVGGALTEWQLLMRGALNPVGNLRVIPDEPPEPREHRPFTLDEMTQRGDAFLDYAAGVGAAVTGASDTQGEAPKFWIVRDENGQWYPDDGGCDAFATTHALLKFPVPEAGMHAPLILQNEAAYQRVAQRLGIRTTRELPRFTNGALIVPRFDRRNRAEGGVDRFGVESLYSVVGMIDSSQLLKHDQVIVELARILTDFKHELREYIWRDLLNLALGNRDNHGRNTAILKATDGMMRLAPVFDIGPTFLDARAITRVLRWDAEEPGRQYWAAIIDRLNLHAREAGIELDVQHAACAFGDFADAIQSLPALIRDCDVDPLVIEHRIPEIERLARSLVDLPRSKANPNA